MPGERILIVEDDVAIKGRELETQLQEHGYEVVGVSPTVAEAVDTARRSKPDLIFMDIRIPLDGTGKEDPDGGFTAAKRIRTFLDPAFVFVTSYGHTTSLMKKVYDASPHAFMLNRPLNPQQTLDTIELALMKRGGRKLIFVCYARQDERLKEEMLQYLKQLEGVGIDAWDDGRIQYGDGWRDEIEAAVERADAAVLLISVHFLNSKFIQSIELPKLLAERAPRRITVVPIYARGGVHPPVVAAKGLDQYQAIGAPDDPLNQWEPKKREKKAWGPLCERLARVLAT